MGKDATACLSYGFTITQSNVLKLLQRLQKSTEEVTFNDYEDAYLLQKLLNKHLEERGLDEQDFEMVFLNSGDDNFEGLVILYKGLSKYVTVWGFGCQKFSPLLSEPWNDADQLEVANAAFKLLGKDSLFKELNIKVTPSWLLGNNMTC